MSHHPPVVHPIDDWEMALLRRIQRDADLELSHVVVRDANVAMRLGSYIAKSEICKRLNMKYWLFANLQLYEIFLRNLTNRLSTKAIRVEGLFKCETSIDSNLCYACKELLWRGHYVDVECDDVGSFCSRTNNGIVNILETSQGLQAFLDYALDEPLTEIEVRNCTFGGSEGLLAYIKTISSKPTIRVHRIDSIQDCTFSTEAIETYCVTLCGLPTLQKLEIAPPTNGAQGFLELIRFLADSLSCSCQIDTLVLPSMILQDPYTCIPLFGSLARLPKLRALSFDSFHTPPIDPSPMSMETLSSLIRFKSGNLRDIRLHRVNRNGSARDQIMEVHMQMDLIHDRHTRILETLVSARVAPRIGKRSLARSIPTEIWRILSTHLGPHDLLMAYPLFEAPRNI